MTFYLESINDITITYVKSVGFPGGASSKEPACQCRRQRRQGFGPRFGKIPWRREWHPTPVFLPGESPWVEEPGGLQSMGSQRVRHTWSYSAHTQEREICTYGYAKFIHRFSDSQILQGFSWISIIPQKACFASNSLSSVKTIQKFTVLVSSVQSRALSLRQIGLGQSMPHKLLPDHLEPVGWLRA